MLRECEPLQIVGKGVKVSPFQHMEKSYLLRRVDWTTNQNFFSGEKPGALTPEFLDAIFWTGLSGLTK